jgi:hypothetical protein
VAQPVGEAARGERRHRAAATLGQGQAGVQQAVRHDVLYGHSGRQVELLEHEPDPVCPQRGEPAVRQRADVQPVHQDGAGARPVEGAHQVQQGRLAGAGRPDDRDHLAALDANGHPAHGAEPVGVGT